MKTKKLVDSGRRKIPQKEHDRRKDMLEKTLFVTRGDIDLSTKILEIGIRTLYNWCKLYDLKPDDFR